MCVLLLRIGPWEEKGKCGMLFIFLILYTRNAQKCSLNGTGVKLAAHYVTHSKILVDVYSFLSSLPFLLRKASVFMI